MGFFARWSKRKERVSWKDKVLRILVAATDVLDHNSGFDFIAIVDRPMSARGKLVPPGSAKEPGRMKKVVLWIGEKLNLLVHSHDDLRFIKMLIAMDKAEAVYFYTAEGLTKEGLRVVFRERLRRLLHRSILNFILPTAAAAIIMLTFVPGPLLSPTTWPFMAMIFVLATRRAKEDFFARRIAKKLLENENSFFSHQEGLFLLRELQDAYFVDMQNPRPLDESYAGAIEHLRQVSEGSRASELEKEMIVCLIEFYEIKKNTFPDEGFLDRFSVLWSSVVRKTTGKFKWLRRIDRASSFFETRLGLNALSFVGKRLPRYAVRFYSTGWFLPIRMLVRLAVFAGVVYYFLLEKIILLFGMASSWLSTAVHAITQ